MEPQEYDRIFQVEDTFWWYRGLRRVILAMADPFLGSRRPLRILDAGCGTGGFFEELSRRGGVVGLDLSHRALSLARRRESGAVVRGSVAALPFASGSMDLVISMDVLYHRAVSSDAEALGEMVRCLRPGGLLCINLPAYSWLRSSHDDVIHTARRYTLARARALLETQSLDILRLSHWNTFLFPAVAAVRLLTKGRDDGESDVRPLPRPLNAALSAILSAEAALLRVMSLPFGLSVAAVARKG